jgi:hypothetical protein
VTATGKDKKHRYGSETALAGKQRKGKNERPEKAVESWLAGGSEKKLSPICLSCC